MATNYKGEEITSIWTPANVVTCVRIVFIPVFMVVSEMSFAAAAPHSAADITGGTGATIFAFAAFALYVLLSLTDKVDGDLARKRQEVTDFGKFLDPIADKLLVFSALLLLLEHGYVNVWYVFIIMFREFLVSALRMVASANGEVIAADKLGKWKTATTMVALCTYLLGIAVTYMTVSAGVSVLAISLQWIANVLMAIAVVLTVVSGAQYFWNARHIVFRV